MRFQSGSSAPAAASARSAASSESGATMVEASFALTFLLLFLLVSLDLIRLAFNVVSLEHVAERGMRRAIIFSENAAAIQSRIINEARGLGIELDPDHNGQSERISICPVNMTCPGSINLGTPGDLLVLRIDVPINIMMFGNSERVIAMLGVNVWAQARARREMGA